MDRQSIRKNHSEDASGAKIQDEISRFPIYIFVANITVNDCSGTVHVIVPLDFHVGYTFATIKAYSVLLFRTWTTLATDE